MNDSCGDTLSYYEAINHSPDDSLRCCVIAKFSFKSSLSLLLALDKLLLFVRNQASDVDIIDFNKFSYFNPLVSILLIFCEYLRQLKTFIVSHISLNSFTIIVSTGGILWILWFSVRYAIAAKDFWR